MSEVIRWPKKPPPYVLLAGFNYDADADHGNYALRMGFYSRRWSAQIKVRFSGAVARKSR